GDEAIVLRVEDRSAEEGLRRRLEEENGRLRAQGAQAMAPLDAERALSAAVFAAAEICGGPVAIYLAGPDGQLRRRGGRALARERAAREEAEAAEARAAFLARASLLLSGGEERAALAAAAELSVPFAADWVLLELYGGDLPSPTPPPGGRGSEVPGPVGGQS